MGESTYNVPKWVAQLAGFVLLMVVPWCGWVTMELSSIKVRLVDNAEIKEAFRAHISDPSIHHAGIARVNARVDILEQRIENID